MTENEAIKEIKIDIKDQWFSFEQFFEKYKPIITSIEGEAIHLE